MKKLNLSLSTIILSIAIAIAFGSTMLIANEILKLIKENRDAILQIVEYLKD